MKQVKKKTKAASKRQKSAQKQAASASNADTAGLEREFPPTVRFSATIHARGKTDPASIEKLDIDRVPDPQGLIRALVTAADCVRLLNQGFEVRLHQAYPVRPINPALIETDDSFKRWLDKRVATIKGAKKQKP